MADEFDDVRYEEALGRLGLGDRVPTLRKGAANSRDTLKKAEAALVEAVKHREAQHIDVVVLGSYARLEASAESDFDYLIVSHRVPQPDRIQSTRLLLQAMDDFIGKYDFDVDQPEAKEADASASRRPGGTGLFGRIASAPDLTERIGLEQDTNISHTRRVLILQESRSVYNQQLHLQLVEAILARYLMDRTGTLEPRTSPPHFLLNDVTRHWYTMAVDYQAKRWDSEDDKWGLRYLKLIGSRKLSFAGTAAALLRCSPALPMSLDDLVKEFRRPPLARLANLALDPGFKRQPALRDVVLFAEHFAEELSDPDFRSLARQARSIPELRKVKRVWKLRTEARKMHGRLVEVFFDSNLGARARKYLVL